MFLVIGNETPNFGDHPKDYNQNYLLMNAE